MGERCGKFSKRLLQYLRIFHVALWALKFRTTFERKGGLAVVAGTTELLGVIAIAGDLCVSGLHAEFQVKVTDTTGILRPVTPMVEYHRLHLGVRAQPVHDDRTVLP